MLRAVAALNVVFFHIVGTAQNYGLGTRALAVLHGWGANGVDIFFVISGFIMVYVQAHKHYSPRRFILNRAQRIVPLYWSLSALFVALYLLMPGAFRELELTPGWVASSFAFLSRPLHHSNPIIAFGWTLEFEVLFYLIFAMSLVSRSIPTAAATAMTLIAGFVLVSRQLILIEFAAGMTIGLVFLWRQIAPRWALLAVIVGVLGLASSIGRPDVEDVRVLVWGIPAALIVFGLVNLPQYDLPLLARLGDASYSIYLIQVFTIPVFYKAMKALGPPAAAGDLYAVAAFVTTAFAGHVTYVLFESRVTRYLTRRTRRDPLPGLKAGTGN